MLVALYRLRPTISAALLASLTLTALAQDCTGDQCTSDVTAVLQTRVHEGDDYVIKDKCDCSMEGYAESWNGLPHKCKKKNACGEEKPYCTCAAKGGNNGCVMARCTSGNAGEACDGPQSCTKGMSCNPRNHECAPSPPMPAPDPSATNLSRGPTAVKACNQFIGEPLLDSGSGSCDLDCRYKYGVFDRAIVGSNCHDGYSTKDGPPCRKGQGAEYCDCYCMGGGGKLGDPVYLGTANKTVVSPTDLGLVFRVDKTPYVEDPNTWGVGEVPDACIQNASSPECRDNIYTDLVCVYNDGGNDPNQLRTMSRSEAEETGKLILHCGQCSACSGPADLQVLYDTRTNITETWTACGRDYALGLAPAQQTRQCSWDHWTLFSHSPEWRFGGPTGPTCMDAWTDDVMCSSLKCKRECFSKIFEPVNPGELDPCLACNEKYCGPKFIQASGASRRAAGIISDIEREPYQICPVGWYGNCMECHKEHCGSTETPECTKLCKEQCDLPKALGLPGPGEDPSWNLEKP